MTLRYRVVQSPVGRLGLVASADAITEIRFLGATGAFTPPPDGGAGPSACLDRLEAELEAYFAGRRRTFDLPLAPTGTDFQQRVWSELRRIPYGETISYGELARRIDRPRASRAVGAANGRNPIPIVVPCHRVIGANGTLTGFGGGLPAKRILLGIESDAREAEPRRRRDRESPAQ